MFTRSLAVLLLVVAVGADDFGMKYLMRIYDDCQRADAVMPCLKKKAILFFDRAARLDTVPLVDGVNMVKSSNYEVVPVSANDTDANLPRTLEAKEESLNEMLWNRIASFANSRSIQLSLPKLTGQELASGVEEGRGKTKKMMGMMMMGAAMKMAAMIPLAIAGLFVLAGKALIVSKIALLLAGIIALKKILAQKNSGGGGGHESHGWSSGGGSGGWDRRSYRSDASSDLAYSAHKRV